MLHTIYIHSLLIRFGRYGVHSVPFAQLACIKVFQDGQTAEPLDVYFWDDDDAVWTLAFQQVNPMQGSSNTYVLDRP